MLIIWHCRRVIPISDILLVARKSFINETDISQGHVQKGPPREFIQLLWYLLIPHLTPLTLPAMKTSQNTQQYPDDREPLHAAVSKWNTRLCSC